MISFCGKRLPGKPSHIVVFGFRMVVPCRHKECFLFFAPNRNSIPLNLASPARITPFMCACFVFQQYDDAIKAYKAGKPVNFDELPAPPGEKHHSLIPNTHCAKSSACVQKKGNPCWKNTLLGGATCGLPSSVC